MDSGEGREGEGITKLDEFFRLLTRAVKVSLMKLSF